MVIMLLDNQLAIHNNATKDVSGYVNIFSIIWDIWGVMLTYSLSDVNYKVNADIIKL